MLKSIKYIFHNFFRYQVMTFMVALGIFALLPSCSKNNSSPSTGTTSFAVTDAPIDDANVTGAFVTISEIDVDGKPVQGFQKTTVNLMAYESGNAKFLHSAMMDAQSHTNVSFVLDYNTDADGNSPGCYVETANNTKEQLSSSTTVFTLNHSFDVMQSASDTLVFDFDLRKAITRMETSTDTTYHFATAAELQNDVRVVTKSKTGAIKGTCTDNTSGSDEIIAYAYAKGTYNSSETSPQGASNVRFAHAVTSARVDSNGNYTLGFLNSGNYELHFASYKKDSSGQMKFNGMLTVSVTGALDLGSIMVNAASYTMVNVSVTGLMPAAN